MTNTTLWSQCCSELVKLLHGCDEVLARLSRGCHNLVISVWDSYPEGLAIVYEQSELKAVESRNDCSIAKLM